MRIWDVAKEESLMRVFNFLVYGIEKARGLEDEGLTIDIHPFFVESKKTIDFGTDTMVAVTFLRVMGSLFDRSEYSPLDLIDL